jgi:hypothetical protein
MEAVRTGLAQLEAGAQELNLNSKAIGAEGARSLAAALLNHATLTSLDL